jgi:predicted metalloprotease with PDZ domain
LRTEDTKTGARIFSEMMYGEPAYQAGLERDDIIVSLGGARVTTSGDVDRALAMRKPGDALQVVYERRGERITTMIKLAENPTLELVPAEEAGQTLTDAQRTFRDSWLSSAARSF